MTNNEFREQDVEGTNKAGQSAVIARDNADHRYRLLATMVQGTAAALPETWQTFRTVEDARMGAREMLKNHRVLRVAVVEDRIPRQFAEWVNR
jgi:hypothetical protein